MTDVLADVTEFHLAMDVPVFYYPPVPGRRPRGASQRAGILNERYWRHVK